jgi:pantoate--beta-alanine ligase
MITVRGVAEVRELVAGWRRDGVTVGVVMTMGALHEGHLSLIAAARARCDRVLATLFVNPLQFGPAEDLAVYPRDEDRDAALLATAGCDALFAPGVAELFPGGQQPLGETRTLIQMRGITEVLCGKVRPWLFPGMCTIVLKLLNVVQADYAFYGEKDYQQYLVLKAMAEDLCLPVRVLACPIVREPDGLAMSSRNAYLTAEQRVIAPCLFRTLRETAAAIRRDGPAHAAELARQASGSLLRGGFERVDYVEVRDQDLRLASQDSELSELRLLAAAYLGKARLIDNVPV